MAVCRLPPALLLAPGGFRSCLQSSIVPIADGVVLASHFSPDCLWLPLLLLFPVPFDGGAHHLMADVAAERFRRDPAPVRPPAADQSTYK
ncbi:hypothetical protein DAI18_14745 [Microvirgula aerodenitrificans]|uniref:Uncharacterized protein n=1 Tax=Microvirgula aerodenitrificans TaxID=57480 RepID=A0A2S0PCV1_9NEIS|nr:hypothetical protein [Microvirgula aerodenitrificans]AVY95162.1 hypothetical protein DAI18_14745 [Microvirgula aerodenitrificans]